MPHKWYKGKVSRFKDDLLDVWSILVLQRMKISKNYSSSLYFNKGGGTKTRFVLGQILKALMFNRIRIQCDEPITVPSTSKSMTTCNR